MTSRDFLWLLQVRRRASYCYKMKIVFCFVCALFVLVNSGSPKCSDYDFPCEDGGCIDSGLWCDSTEDCDDGSDEKYCKKSDGWNSDPNKCPSNYFKCNDGPCIPIAGRCDGYESCDDSSDEMNCASSTTKHYSPTSKPLPTSGKRMTATARTTTTTKTPSGKLESRTTHLPATSDTLEHFEQIVYSSFGSSGYFHQREMARAWLLSQRNDDFGWGQETPRALTALYLSDLQGSNKRNETDLLMVKQLEVQLSLDMARNGTKIMKLTDLALYINALMASCKDPKNFYGENLVLALRYGVDAAQREGTFVNPSVYLALCMNNATTYEDTRGLHNIFISRNVAIGRMDIQALALLTATCIFRSQKFLPASMYDDLKKQFLRRLNAGGLPGNVYEAALLAQALQELKATQKGLLDFILMQQQEDGSFGGILATYLVLPVLAGRSFLEMNAHCSQRYVTDFDPIEVLKNSKRRKIFLHYSLNYGNPPEITQMIQMKVPEGTHFLDVMRLAQEVNPNYRFILEDNREIPAVYSIGGIPNDAEKGLFWTLHITSNSNRVGGNTGRLTPFSGNIKQLIPHTGDELVFWMKSM